MKTPMKIAGALALVAIIFGILLPPPGHGDYMNPLRITLDPLSQDIQQEYTDKMLNGEITLKSVGPPQLISNWSEVELAPPDWGWGSDTRNAIRFYKLSDELYNKICDDFDTVRETVHKESDIEIAEHASPFGPHLVGCAPVPRKKVDLTKEKLNPESSLYFNSLFKKPEDFKRLLGDTTTLFVSTFFSEFPKTRHTSPMHIALSPSLAVQCHGGKIWNFVPPRAIGKYGGRAFNGAAMLRGVDEDEEQWVVWTTKGTVLTFPPYWAHNVFSYAGPSFMYTLRKSYGGSVLKNLLVRAFRERLSLWNILPPWNGKTAYENTKEGLDIHGVDCPNLLKEDELNRLMEMNEKIAADQIIDHGTTY